MALAIVLGLAAAGYAAAPWLLTAIAVRSLDGIVEVRELDIESVGLSRIDIAVVRVDNRQMRFSARQAAVRFDPWPFRIRGIDIRKARLELTGAPPGPGAGGDVAPALPPFPLRIDELSLQLATPWGQVALPVSITAAPGGAGGATAEIQGPDFSAVLTNPDENRHVLDLHDADHAGFLSLDARTGGGSPVAFDGRLEPDRLASWLQASRAVPPELKPILAPYAVAGGPVTIHGALAQDLDFTAELRGTITLSDEREPGERIFETIELELNPGHRIARTGASWSGSGEGGFAFAPDPDTRLTGRNPVWRWNENGLSFSATEARLEPLALAADTIEARSSEPDADGANGSIRAAGFRFDGWPETLAHYDLDGDWSWADSTLNATGTGSGVALPKLGWQLETGESRGSLEINVQDAVAALEPSLGHYTAAVADDLKILAGDLNGRYVTEWDADRQRTLLELDAGSVDADLGGMEIRGMSVRVDNRDDGMEQLAIAVAAPTLKLAAGTVAEELEIDLRLALPRVHVDTARTRLFEGGISLRPLSFDLDDEEIEMFVDIESLSLASVMALLELESTELTGEVAGPVRMLYSHDRGLEINKGDLRSVKAGVLRFTMGPDSPAAEQYNNIALRALENFQYDELNASLLYRPDGEYRISARILGRNPEVLDGHPIALNPTIEGRLPALFRAFLITGDFNRAIIDRLREEQNLSTPGKASSLEND